MNTKKNLTLILLLLSTEIFAQVIPKDKLISAMETGLPDTFCNPQTPFRQCFNITSSECIETTSSATRACTKKLSNQFPEFISSREDAGKMGNDIGECVGRSFMLTHFKKRITNNQCNKMFNLQ